MDVFNQGLEGSIGPPLMSPESEELQKIRYTLAPDAGHTGTGPTLLGQMEVEHCWAKSLLLEQAYFQLDVQMPDDPRLRLLETSDGPQRGLFLEPVHFSETFSRKLASASEVTDLVPSCS